MKNRSRNQRGSSSKLRMDEDERPAFFKVFIPELCSQRMQIPPAFAANFMRGQRIKNATFLRDCWGNVWPIEIIIKGRAFFFEKGWVRFVEDNRIDMGDFLVFELSVDLFFDFKHFGRSVCEKEKCSSSFRFTVKQDDLESEGEEEEEEEESEDDNEEEEEEEVAVNNAYIGEDDNDYDEAEGGEEEDDDNNDEDDAEYDEKLKDNGKNDEEEEKKEQGSMRGSKRKRLKRSDFDEFENEIFGSGVVPIPKNPYFVVKIRPQKRQDLFIPVCVVRDHGLKLPSEMDIVDENRKRWPSKVKVWGIGRIVLKKGWKAFRRWNRIKTDDKCLFEFVRDRKNKGKKLCLQVRIFRA